MTEMIEQALANVKYYITYECYYYLDPTFNKRTVAVNILDIDKYSIDFALKYICDNHNCYSVPDSLFKYNIILEYPVTWSEVYSKSVTLVEDWIFCEKDFSEVKDKTIGECILDRLNDLDMSKYDELTTIAIEQLKYLLSLDYAKRKNRTIKYGRNSSNINSLT